MPIHGARYRVMTTPKGKKVRLAFKGKGKVVEAKSLDSGKVHTAAEFAADAAKRKRKPQEIERMVKRGKHVSF